ncbi:hypothetical protein B296_00003499 [Ensete ventricosum]|uniref:Protein DETOXIFICATION n=1 Tax=Ensete ventricosum TaxID=4639 RepID=A0A427AQX1_ENSVE|nr:hypothetical protein B296_00003499 [Ensete ventricosum]
MSGKQRRTQKGMERGEERVALLHGEGEEDRVLARRCLIESKKLWLIVGPAVFSRVVTYSMNVITLAFAGHLGLASITIANTVVIGFSFGLMVSITINFLSLRVFVVSTPPLGMASGLETLCGQAFGARKYDMLGVYMQRSWIVLFMCAVLLPPMYFFATPILTLTDRVAAGTGGTSRGSVDVVYPAALLLRLSPPEIPAVRAQELHQRQVDAISICVRVANELGAGDGKGARFATIVSVTTSSAIGLFFCVLIVLLHEKFAFIYTTSSVVLEAVDKLSVLHSILLFQVPSSCTLQAAITNARMEKWSGPNRP